MGTKRAFDEEFQEFVKHPKHLDYVSKLPLFAEDKLPYEASRNAGIPGESGDTFYNFPTGEGQEIVNANNISDLPEEEFETGAPLSLVTSSSGEEVDGSGTVLTSSLFPDYFEFNFPRRQIVQIDDTYSSLLNSSPRKEVPVGPNHQADLPELESEVVKEHSTNSVDIVSNDHSEKFLGSCVMPMPDLDSSPKKGEAGDDRVYCKCLGSGSVRCVQQHVREARLNLREILGKEKFVGLGLYDMGEEVALRWTEEEERIFHEVVYCNPVSLWKKFWERLSIAFPSRTKLEIVSYYFNVFILRKRAGQNRSYLMEIDSDDDEWRASRRVPLGAGGEEQDFVIVDESSSDDGDGDDDGGDGVLIGEADATEKRVWEFGGTEDSCTSFEGQQNGTEFSRTVHDRASAIQEKRVEPGQGKCLDEGFESGYVLEQCNGKAWDAAPYSPGPQKASSCYRYSA